MAEQQIMKFDADTETAVDENPDWFDIDYAPPRGRIDRIMHYVVTRPWAMEPSRLADVMDVLREVQNGRKLSREDAREYCGQPPVGVSEMHAAHGKSLGSGGAVAVIPLRGIIAHRMGQIEDVSGPGGTSVERFREDFRAALATREVGTVVIDIDSPGGNVEGVQELAEEIHNARGEKPIIAVANALAASAAYWVGSAADEFSVTPSGQVGSIGVFAAHEDISEQLAAEGRKITLISAGKFKTEGSPFGPLTEEAEAYIQSRVDASFAKFVTAIAVGRGVSAATVKNDFGQGRLVDAEPALAAGMVDRVETLEAAIGRFRGAQSRSGARAQMALRRQGLAFK